MRLKYFLAHLFLVLVTSTVVWTSTAIGGTTGILEGRVRDKNTGETIAGATVMIIGTNLGTATDSVGMYRINNIRAGVYEVRFSILGYKIVIVKNVTILPDLRTRVDVQMEQTTIQFETVEVTAHRPLIQKDLAATSFVVGNVKLEKLPISSFQEVLVLQPSTTLEGNVRGGKAQEIVFLVDGLPVQVGDALAEKLHHRDDHPDRRL